MGEKSFHPHNFQDVFSCTRTNIIYHMDREGEKRKKNIVARL